ncbi:MAG: cyclic nucleotide-binding domain-containing protein, partial [Acidimicrobiia bacterium]
MQRSINALTTLHHVPLFASCSKKDLARIVKVAEEVTFKSGKVLIEQGQPGREAFIILKGKASVRRNGVRCRGNRGRVAEICDVCHTQ